MYLLRNFCGPLTSYQLHARNGSRERQYPVWERLQPRWTAASLSLGPTPQLPQAASEGHCREQMEVFHGGKV